MSTEAGPPLDIPLVRMGMGCEDAAQLSDALLTIRGTEAERRLLDQLWLRTVLLEQRKRVLLTERATFDRRGDRALAALDPEDAPVCPACGAPAEIAAAGSRWWATSCPHAARPVHMPPVQLAALRAEWAALVPVAKVHVATCAGEPITDG